MTLTPQQRWMVIGSALVLTLGAMYQVDQQADDSQEDSQAGSSLVDIAEDLSGGAAHRSRKSAEASQQAQASNAGNGILPDLANKESIDAATTDTDADLLKSHVWYVPPPPPKISLAETERPVPVAPPVPFGYMGKLENTPQGTLIFLSANNKVLTVVAGQQVDAAWRLDKEDANALHFTYVPLDLPKTLSKSAKAAAPASANAAMNQDGFAYPAALSNDEILNN